MKLINFVEDNDLNTLRERMKAKLVKWDGLSQWDSFDPFGFRAALRKNGEVDIPFKEINVASDKTLELFGQKVLVYIRDQRYSKDLEYKFHVANCATLINAYENGRYDRYVASINTNGIFKVNLLHGYGSEKDKSVKLKVCKNCLRTLNYKKYSRETYANKVEVYNKFNLDDFFRLYQIQNIKTPKYTNITAPINDYTKDFSRIAKDLKSRKGYICEVCRHNLSSDRKFVHVHHIDGVKSNNRQDNLKVVCISCHAKEPAHGHMKALPDYREYQQKYNSR